MSDYEIILDVIDENDQVVNSLPSQKVHEKGLLHRAIHILIVNNKGHFFVRQRSRILLPLHPINTSTLV